MSLAILCSGQGRQHRGMFALTEGVPEAAGIFAAASRVLDGRDPRDIARQDDAASMQTNRIGQVLCCSQALAAHAALRNEFGREVLYAGYSVGEVAAWGCAGIFDAETTLGLARRRAAFMDESSASGDGLVYVRGLPRAMVEALCAGAGTAIAIVNPGDGFVIGGMASQLDAFCEAASRTGASRTGRLAVRVAAHTARLADATAKFRAALHNAGPAARLPPGVRLLSGIDGENIFAPADGADKLAAQISQTVQWAACLQACMEAGVTAMLELGPGRALADMAATASCSIEARSIEEFRSIDGVRAWLARR